MEVVKEPIKWPNRGRRSRYDWDSILDGQQWKLTIGEDFDCKPESFRSAAVAAARSRGKRVRSMIDEESIYLVAFDRKAGE